MKLNIERLLSLCARNLMGYCAATHDSIFGSNTKKALYERNHTWRGYIYAAYFGTFLPLLATAGLSILILKLVRRACLRSYTKVNFESIKKTALLALEFLCRPEDREGVIGDLEEACNDIQNKHGERAADAYFWWQFARSVVEFVWAAIKRWGWVAAIFGALGWITRKLSS